MGNLVEILCKTPRKTLRNICAQKCKKVNQWVFKHSFSTIIRKVLNRKISPYNKLNIHSFHIAYNYYYLNN